MCDCFCVKVNDKKFIERKGESMCHVQVDGENLGG